MPIDTVVGTPISPPNAPGGPNVSTIVDTSGFTHQTVVLETQVAGADPVVVGANNPLPISLASGGAQAGNPGTPSSDVLSVQGITGMTPVNVSSAIAGAVGCPYFNGIAPTTPTVVTAKSTGGNVFQVFASNSGSPNAFIKFWDTTSPPTLGTTPCSYQFMIPGTTGCDGIAHAFSVPRTHVNGIYFAVTDGIALNDNTGVTANTVIYDVSAA